MILYEMTNECGHVSTAIRATLLRPLFATQKHIAEHEFIRTLDIGADHVNVYVYDNMHVWTCMCVVNR